MREDAFRSWMASRGNIGLRPMGDAISRCKRVHKGLGINLDEEYAKDGGRSLIELLNYTEEDVLLNHPAPAGINFKPGANIKNGMASLKSAVNKYFEFCTETK